MVAVLSSTSVATETLDVEDEHAELLADFYRKVWDPEATPERVLAARARAAAANTVEPGRAPPTVALLSHQSIIGYVTTIPAPVFAGGREHGVYWVKGLMVLPEHQNGPVGYLVLRHLLKRIGPAMGMVVHPHARKLFQALGFRDSGTLGNYAKPLRQANVIRKLDLQRLGMGGPRSRLLNAAGLLTRTWLGSRLAGAAVGLGVGAVAATSGRTGILEVCSTPSSELDRIWARMRERIPAAVSRTGSELHQRYLASGGNYLISGIARRSGNLAGAAIVRRPRSSGDPRLNGITVATISEVLCDPDCPLNLSGTIASAERAALRSGADLLVASASDPRLRRGLSRRGFVRVPANLHLLTRFPKGEGVLPDSVADWWLTRGDSSADEVF